MSFPLEICRSMKLTKARALALARRPVGKTDHNPTDGSDQSSIQKWPVRLQFRCEQPFRAADGYPEASKHPLPNTLRCADAKTAVTLTVTSAVPWRKVQVAHRTRVLINDDLMRGVHSEFGAHPCASKSGARTTTSARLCPTLRR